MTVPDSSSANGGPQPDLPKLPPLTEDDRQVLDELYDRYRRHLVNYVRLKSDLDPDDVVQDVYTRVMRGMQRGNQPPRHWRAYLLRVTQRTMADHARAARTAQSILPRLVDQGFTDFGHEAGYARIETADLHDRLQRLLINPDFAQAWYLTVEREMSSQEVSRRTGVPAQTVRTRVSRARSILGDTAHWPI